MSEQRQERRKGHVWTRSLVVCIVKTGVTLLLVRTVARKPDVASISQSATSVSHHTWTKKKNTTAPTLVFCLRFCTRPSAGEGGGGAGSFDWTTRRQWIPNCASPNDPGFLSPSPSLHGVSAAAAHLGACQRDAWLELLTLLQNGEM